MNPTHLVHILQSMPKAELHVHLEGSIQPPTLLELARRHNLLHSLPAQEPDGLRDWFRFTDFRHFVEVYLVISDLLRTPDDFALITVDFGAQMAQHNCRYAEVTFTPYTHTDYLDKGLTIDDLFAGLDAGRALAQQKYGVEIRWVFDIPRNFAFRDGNGYDPRPADATADYALRGRDRGVIGLGLGGNEASAPPAPFAHAFAAALQGGLRSLPHAGETVGPESVWGALHALGAHRIGHGVRAVEDPLLLSYLAERRIPLEVNITSNVCLHVYQSAAHHPLPHLDRMGLLLTVNSDDPPLFNTDLTREYTLLVTEFGYNLSDVVRLARNAFLVASMSDALRTKYLVELEHWTADAESKLSGG